MYNYVLHVLLRLFLSSLVILSFNSLIAQTIEGYVFIDENENSIMDSGEEGLSGVIVSNQKDATITNELGHFEIKAIEGNFIFVTKPEHYQFKLDQYNNPQFHFFIRKKEIKDELMYPGAKPAGEIPEVLYFPVYKNHGEENYSALLVGDPQMTNVKELRYYKEGIVPLLAEQKANFYVILGDIANNNIAIFPREKEASTAIGIPGYRVFGNHDINFKASGNKHASETFKMVYGPDYYSFEYGNFHYIVLNSINYQGYQKDTRKPGKYSGGLTSEQLKWIENNLTHVPSSKTIVLLSHIPMHENYVNEYDLQVLYKSLQNHKKILAVSGHLHSIIAYDHAPKKALKYDVKFDGLVAGATCGAWWSGPLDENNIPVSICFDGTTKGFFRLNVTDNDYRYVFHSANTPRNFQMRTSIYDGEIWVNWFVGKKTDRVKAYINDNPTEIILENIVGIDPFVRTYMRNERYTDEQIERAGQTAHLWKAKLPEGLTSGPHTIKIVATDSYGRVFNDSITFTVDYESILN